MATTKGEVENEEDREIWKLLEDNPYPGLGLFTVLSRFMITLAKLISRY